MFSNDNGGDDSLRAIFVAQIFSDQPSDVDIAFDPVQQTLTITNGPGTLFFGIDDLDPNLPEYRHFLDFPLNGSNGRGWGENNKRKKKGSASIWLTP